MTLVAEKLSSGKCYKIESTPDNRHALVIDWVRGLQGREVSSMTSVSIIV